MGNNIVKRYLCIRVHAKTIYLSEKSVVSGKKIEKSTVREYTEAIIIAIVLAIFIRTFIVQAFKIPSGSMLPTLQIGDHLLVNKFMYGLKNPFTGKVIVPLKNPKRGDVVVFLHRQSGQDYIKRVLAVEGETIELRNGDVFINNEAIDDKHACYSTNIVKGGLYTTVCNNDPAVVTEEKSAAALHQYSYELLNYGPVTVPEGHLFVMGDNRFHSSDSRFWGFVDRNDVLGKAFILYWSWDATKDLMSAERWKSIAERYSRIGNIVH